MRKNDTKKFRTFCNILNTEFQQGNLPGLEDTGAIESLAMQLIESQRRIDFVTTVSTRPISAERLNPRSDLFDPIRAAILKKQQGDIDEASWLVFLSVHFGHNLRTKWRLMRDVYGSLGGKSWTWSRVLRNPIAFRKWLDGNQAILRGGDGVKRSFGNHRKYTSLDAWKPNATGDAIATYVEWVRINGGHESLFNAALENSLGDSGGAFDDLYRSMRGIASFGRIGRFDYLTMIGKTGIAPITPPSPYLAGATGPLTGAKLLFGQNYTVIEYERKTIKLGEKLLVNMQVMEDSICNWQKSPSEFKAFRG